MLSPLTKPDFSEIVFSRVGSIAYGFLFVGIRQGEIDRVTFRHPTTGPGNFTR